MAIRPERDDLVAFLNSLVDIDRGAMQAMVTYAVGCNQALAEHPSVQVRAEQAIGRGADQYWVGVLGILNGFLGTIDDGPLKGYGGVMALFDDGELVGFCRSEDRLQAAT